MKDPTLTDPELSEPRPPSLLLSLHHCHSLLLIISISMELDPRTTMFGGRPRVLTQTPRMYISQEGSTRIWQRVLAKQAVAPPKWPRSWRH
ncbi:unnamed protein product [Linum trigynum]|uniref:Uncharacterized protein n=1 Tax=Linum trigynum TaxID=586398 RepID=A0AAV2CDB6_9ROSI